MRGGAFVLWRETRGNTSARWKRRHACDNHQCGNGRRSPGSRL